ncbi:MAG: ORF6N domain-containing protein, partial [Gammaproteobacteria bacterium]
SPDAIARRIYVVRGQRVMLSGDLAALYGVSAKVLIQAVRRNSTRFPRDFMFRVRWEEARAVRADQSRSVSESTARLRSQIVTLKRGRHSKYPPYAFTEHGVAMLSSVLRSKRAVAANIAIMRAFVKLRGMLESHRELSRKLDDLENKYDAQFRSVFDAIRRLMQPAAPPRRRIGFLARAAD